MGLKLHDDTLQPPRVYVSLRSPRRYAQENLSDFLKLERGLIIRVTCCLVYKNCTNPLCHIHFPFLPSFFFSLSLFQPSPQQPQTTFFNPSDATTTNNINQNTQDLIDS
ncbi:hypothetical protein QVD17_23982 [Tagetes erecta]|uniref:Uncharacterized protein n=1 Tax=Tagetes erecta TaxID=13708 RepID=A0AAD8KF53_TARER|nr:hypothetical protein QVD17_23982 [Tagetes erecta]